ncbi:MAG: class D sortase [Firmicutes bacterium]|jgi:sortase A|nr:class D sortase [Bacillota bacterium]
MDEKKRKYAVIILILGIFILLIPIVKSKIDERKNIHLLSQFKIEKKKYQMDYLENAVHLIKLNGESENTVTSLDKSEVAEDLNKSEEANEEVKTKKEYDLMGILEIPKINFEKPIIRNASKENLKISVCSMNGESDMKDIKNLVIAGHNSRTYGKDFNRLNEIEKEDIIKVKDIDKTYNYKIYKKFVVKDDETWILSNVEDKDIITLFTCTYQGKEKMRLVLRGVKI